MPTNLVNDVVHVFEKVPLFVVIVIIIQYFLEILY